MKFDPGKAWPHPVLRPPNFGDDYPEEDFQVDIKLEKNSKGISAALQAKFYLGCHDLNCLIQEGRAAFAMLICSPKTHYRELFQSKSSDMLHFFENGELGGRVEFYPLIVALENFAEFSLPSWHSDYSGEKFNLLCGSILAEDEPREYWIYPEAESSLGSFMTHKKLDGLEDGTWSFNFGNEKIEITMSESTLERFESARDYSTSKSEANYIINGLYLPVLTAVLMLADNDIEEYAECRWFNALDIRLGQVNCPALGEKSKSRYLDAQKILESPLNDMLESLLSLEEDKL